MAAGDLILGQGGGSLLGYAQGVSVAVPASGTTTIVSNDTASWVAAVETANERVIASSGLTFAPSSQVTIAAGVQAYCPNGSFTVDGDAIGGTEMLVAIEDNQFIGNMIMEPSIGTAGLGNNPGVAIEMAWGKSSSDTNGIYLFYVELHPDPLIASMSGDRPEGFQAWMGSTAYTRLITMHGCNLPAAHELSNSKYMTVGSGTTDGASGIKTTLHRCYAYVWRRFPLVGDAASTDMVNCVFPDMVARRETGMISRDASTKTNVRGCYVYGNEILTQAEIKDESSGSVYYVTTGGGNDNNFEVNSPTIDLNPAQTTDRIGAYTGKPSPAAMDGTLQTAIEADGAGTYAITQETPPETLDPISAGHAAYLSFHKELSPTIHLTSMEPYEQRFRESIEYNHFYRWNNAARTWIKEWTADWPGLNPHAERRWNLIPAFTGVY